MTNFEKLKAMDVNSLAAWLDKNGIIDNSPWFEDFNNKYCANCESVMCKYEDAEKVLGFKPCFSEEDIECTYCEAHKKCRFFPDMAKAPEGAEMVKLWLEAEVNE